MNEIEVVNNIIDDSVSRTICTCLVYFQIFLRPFEKLESVKDIGEGMR
jgi:hypothetical protein